MTQMKFGGGPDKPAYRRQRKAYPLLRKVSVNSEGNVFRATDDEIVNAPRDVKGVEG